MSSISSTRAPVDARSNGGVIASIARRDPVVLAVCLVLVASFAYLFHRWLRMQLGPGGFSLKFPEDWGHAFVIPLISGYAVWRNRAALLDAPARAYWPALVPVGFSVLAYFYFVLGYPNHMFQGFAMILALASIVLLVAGPRVLSVLAFPIGYLALGVTISEMVMNLVTFKLKLLASVSAHYALLIFQVDNDLAGNLLTVYPPGGGDPVPLNVADACSGMRMVIAFVALGVAVAFLSCRHWWQRICLVLLAVPIALMMNVVRVVVLALLGIVDPDLSVGEAHSFIGTVLLVPALLLYMACVWALHRMEADRTAPAGGAS
jgi:exosortase